MQTVALGQRCLLRGKSLSRRVGRSNPHLLPAPPELRDSESTMRVPRYTMGWRLFGLDVITLAI